MYKKAIQNLVLITAVLAICIGWLGYRYQTEHETILVRKMVDGKATDVSKKVKKFPLNLGLDIKGGVQILLEAIPPKNEPLTPEMMLGVVEVMERRLNPTGTREVTITKQGEKYVNIEIPGERDPDKVEKLIGKTAKLQFIDTRGEQWNSGDTVPEDAKVMFSGDDLKRAQADFDQYGKPCVSFEFNKEKAEEFGKYTARNIDRPMAIALDKKVVSCPVIRSAIFGGHGQISGDFTAEEVQDLVTVLNSGRLPVDVMIAEKRAVGPSLGADSIRKSLIAGLVGVVLVLIFMVVNYRLPGIIANLALLLYCLINLGILSMFNATLTLPGIAGFILSIGMAVDANVIIFERLKEELRLGKSLKAGLEAGFTRAFPAILDSNVTTLIATVVLYAMGTGPIRGFAVTLTIGILVSMFSALFISKTFLVFITYSKAFQSLGLYGVKQPKTDKPLADIR